MKKNSKDDARFRDYKNRLKQSEEDFPKFTKKYYGYECADEFELIQAIKEGKAIPRDPDPEPEETRIQKWEGLINGLKLERMLNFYNEGDNDWLLPIIAFCLSRKIEIPNPINSQFCESIDKWINLKVGSLDDAFNVAPRHAHRLTREKKLGLRFRIFDEVNKLHENNEAAISDDFFDNFAKQNKIKISGLSGSKVKKLYYEAKKLVEIGCESWNFTLSNRVASLHDNEKYKEFVQRISKLHEND